MVNAFVNSSVTLDVILVNTPPVIPSRGWTFHCNWPVRTVCASETQCPVNYWPMAFRLTSRGRESQVFSMTHPAVAITWTSGTLCTINPQQIKCYFISSLSTRSHFLPQLWGVDSIKTFTALSVNRTPLYTRERDTFTQWVPPSPQRCGAARGAINYKLHIFFTSDRKISLQVNISNNFHD